MQKLSEDIIVVLGASVFFLLISVFIVFLLMAYKRRDKEHVLERKRLKEEFNNQLLKSQIEVQEQTFQLIGKELHDNVGQLLSTTRMLIGLAERNMQTPPDTLLTANATLGKAISELRSLSKSLDKEWLEQFNIIDNLKTEVERLNATNTINASLNITDQPKLPSSKQIILFRIVQEAIQNAIKHGNCSTLLINFFRLAHQFTIVISDDGKGFDSHNTSTGMGLKNMHHRAYLLGGTVHYESETNKGTNITIRIPENLENEN